MDDFPGVMSLMHLRHNRTYVSVPSGLLAWVQVSLFLLAFLGVADSDCAASEATKTEGFGLDCSIQISVLGFNQHPETEIDAKESVVKFRADSTVRHHCSEVELLRCESGGWRPVATPIGPERMLLSHAHIWADLKADCGALPRVLSFPIPGNAGNSVRSGIKPRVSQHNNGNIGDLVGFYSIQLPLCGPPGERGKNSQDACSNGRNPSRSTFSLYGTEKEVLAGSLCGLLGCLAGVTIISLSLSGQNLFSSRSRTVGLILGSGLTIAALGAAAMMFHSALSVSAESQSQLELNDREQSFLAAA